MPQRIVLRCARKTLQSDADMKFCGVGGGFGNKSVI